MTTEPVLHFESNRRKQLGLLAGLALVGAIQLVAFTGLRRFDGSGVGEGLVLGGLVVLVAAAGIVLGRRRSVIVDGRERTVVIEDATRIGARRESIPFADVRVVELERVGDDEASSSVFDIVLALRSGRRVHLFGGAFFDQRHDRASMERTREELGALLRAAA
jgi:hypothetical protein